MDCIPELLEMGLKQTTDYPEVEKLSRSSLWTWLDSETGSRIRDVESSRLNIRLVVRMGIAPACVNSI